MKYEIVMGLEVHVELSTKTKIFCGCSTEFGGEPNSHTCPVCLGLPGSLPVLNIGVVERALRAGIATNCEIQQSNIFDRKNYFYPDLPKDYQISQLYHPICRNGSVEIETESGKKSIRIHEIHMEEDAGKLIHDASGTLIDYNRCGVPLIEIVSEPDFRSADEVIAYLEKLRETLVYLDVSDCRMQEGSMRADVNLSVRPEGSDIFGTRTEMKNINSFKAIRRAIAYESERQISLISAGGRVVQETRRWDDEAGETSAMRSKENAQDYRYFPDPDLIPISISSEWIEEARDGMPELPEQKRLRYVSEYGITPSAAKIITAERRISQLFESVAEKSREPKTSSNIITGELLGFAKEAGIAQEDIDIDSDKLASAVRLIADEKVNRNVGKILIEEILKNDIDPEIYVRENGMLIIEDTDLIKRTIDEIIEENSKSVSDYKSGKSKAFGFLVGQAMRRLGGKASPKVVNEILKKRLGTVEVEEIEVKETSETQSQKAKSVSEAVPEVAVENADVPQKTNQHPVFEVREPQLTPAQMALKRAGISASNLTEAGTDAPKTEEKENPAFRANRYRTHTCGQLTVADVGAEVKLSGWVSTIRDHGGIVFVDLRDHYGITQIVVTEEMLKCVCRETVIEVVGTVVRRAEETVNPHIITGLIEVKAEDLEVLGASKSNLPFETDMSRETREDVRLAYRFLDLRNTKIHDNIVLRSKIISFMRREMEEMGFLEIQTPILGNSSPEGARDYLVPSRKHKGSFYALPQAPQQFKQMLMASGFDRYFQVAPCFRDEDARLDRSPGEFYQLDFEMAFASQEDVFAVAEKLLYETFCRFTNLEVSKPPFIKIPFEQAMLKYGTDKPDLRNPLEIIDLSEFFSGVDFKPFQGKIVRAIKVPGAVKQSKSWFSSMEKFALGIGMKGLGYISVIDDLKYKGPIDKFMSDDQRVEITALAGLQKGDVLYFISDEKGVVEKYAGKIRTELGERLNLIDKSKYEFCYITDFPMYEINEETGKIDFTHNPFSMPQGEMEALETLDPLKVYAYQYDIVCNGYELSSGAVRNHRPDIMVKAFEIAGYTEEDVKSKFKALYEAFQYGAPPHAGMAPGVDRIVMLLTGEENIREVIAFPLNSNAQDLLFGSPTPVSELQLRDVHIKVR